MRTGSANKIRQIIVPILLFLVSCQTGVSPEQRAEIAAENKGDIEIGIVYTSVYSNFFLEGVTLAVNEINNKGGVIGRKLRIIVDDDKKEATEAEKIAKKLSMNNNVVAVIGHGNSNTAIPASVIYEKAGILFISYGTKDPDLTLYGGNYTFRNIPTQKEFGRRIAEFAKQKGGKRVLVFHERDADYKSLADIFKKEATAHNIKIVATRSYFGHEREFRKVIAALKKVLKPKVATDPEMDGKTDRKSNKDAKLDPENDIGFDSVLISGSMPAAGELVKQLREMGIGGDIPIIGSDGLDSPDLLAISGKAAEGLYVPTVFNPEYPDKVTQDFIRHFQDRYELPPDTWAAQGYDAVFLLAHLIEENGAVNPLVLGTNLQFLEKWKGVTGSYSFTSKGDIAGKEIFFKKMEEGKFSFVREDWKYEVDLFNYIKENTLRLPLKKKITTLDPSKVKNKSDKEVCESLFLGLTRLDSKTYQPKKELASGWSKCDNLNNCYKFKIRNDAKWSNGESVTANDVKWAIQRNLKKETGCKNYKDLFILKNAEAVYNNEMKMSELKVVVENDKQIKFFLEYDAPYFPSLLSLPVFRPLPAKVIKKHKDKWTGKKNIVVNGPYKPAKWEKGRGLFLTKNRNYYDEKNVAIREVRYFIIPQSAVGLAMYENDELDIMGGGFLRLPDAALKRIKKAPVMRHEFHQTRNFCTYTYAFNTEKPPVNDLFVRKAISGAINRQLIINVMGHKSGKPARTTIMQNYFSAEYQEMDAGKGFGFDPDQAKKWLEKAGYPNGQNFPRLTISSSESKIHRSIAESVKSMLEHYLNIEVKILVHSERSYSATQKGGNNSHIFRVKVCNNYPDADSILKIFDPTDIQCNTKWENKEYTKILNEARDCIDTKARNEMYKRAEAILCLEEAVIIPLFFEKYNMLVKSRIKEWTHMAIGGQQVFDWSFKVN